MPSCFHGILLQPGVSPPSPVTAFFSSCLERWFFTLHVRHRILWSACNKSYTKTYFKQENNLMQLQKESSRYPVWIIFYWTLPVFAAGEASVTPSPAPPGVAYGTGFYSLVGLQHGSFHNSAKRNISVVSDTTTATNTRHWLTIWRLLLFCSFSPLGRRCSRGRAAICRDYHLNIITYLIR